MTQAPWDRDSNHESWSQALFSWAKIALDRSGFFAVFATVDPQILRKLSFPLRVSRFSGSITTREVCLMIAIPGGNWGWFHL